MKARFKSTQLFTRTKYYKASWQTAWLLKKLAMYILVLLNATDNKQTSWHSSLTQFKSILLENISWTRLLHMHGTFDVTRRM